MKIVALNSNNKDADAFEADDPEDDFRHLNTVVIIDCVSLTRLDPEETPPPMELHLLYALLATFSRPVIQS